jgi:hypothetical protein
MFCRASDQGRQRSLRQDVTTNVSLSAWTSFVHRKKIPEALLFSAVPLRYVERNPLRANLLGKK